MFTSKRAGLPTALEPIFAPASRDKGEIARAKYRGARILKGFGRTCEESEVLVRHIRI